jgi:hypothetical protein
LEWSFGSAAKNALRYLLPKQLRKKNSTSFEYSPKIFRPV